MSICTPLKRLIPFCLATAAGFSGPAAAAAFPGPDNFGHVGHEIVFNLRDVSATGTGVGIDNSDDQTGVANIGFDFSFYGNTFSQVAVSSNGFISFDIGADDACCNGDPIPTAGGDIDNFIAAWWDDLDPGNTAAGIVRVQTVGTTGSREFIVGFYDVSHFSDATQSNTFEIILHEGSNDIELQYLQTQIEGNHDVAVGIENAAGTDGIEVDFLETVATDTVRDTEGTQFLDGALFYNEEGYCISFNGTTCDAVVISSRVGERVAEVNEEAAAETASVQTTIIATTVNNRVRAAFRSVGFGGAPKGGAPAGGNGAPELGYTGNRATGRAAGELGDNAMGLWFSPTYTELDSAGSNGHTLTFATGADMLIDETTVVGASVSFESTENNLTGALAGNSSDANGGSLIVYAGRQIDPKTLIDGFVGYGLLNNEVTQAAGSAEYDSRRFIAGGTVSRSLDVNEQVDVVVSGGVTYSNEDFDSYTLGGTTINQSDVSLFRGSLEAEVSGRVDDAYPYAILGVEKEFHNSASSEDKSVVFGGGVIVLPADNVSLDLSVLVRRGDFNDSESLNANLRWSF